MEGGFELELHIERQVVKFYTSGITLSRVATENLY